MLPRRVNSNSYDNQVDQEDSTRALRVVRNLTEVMERHMAE